MYEHPGPVLVILGGSTVAALDVGIVYGQGKRVWCRCEALLLLYGMLGFALGAFQ